MVLDLNLYTEPFQLIWVIICGFIYDLAGRRFTILGCFIICAVSTFLCPFPTDVYPFYLILKMGNTATVSGILSNPLVNDYTDVKTRPRAFAFGGFFGFLAHIF